MNEKCSIVMIGNIVYFCLLNDIILNGVVNIYVVWILVFNGYFCKCLWDFGCGFLMMLIFLRNVIYDKLF